MQLVYGFIIMVGDDCPCRFHNNHKVDSTHTASEKCQITHEAGNRIHTGNLQGMGNIAIEMGIGIAYHK